MAESRRSFLKWATHGLGVVFAAVLGAPAIAYLIDGRNRPAPPTGYRPVEGIDLEEFKTQPRGTARQGVIRAVRRDAWTLHPNDVIGRVWVVKAGDGAAASDIHVFTTICTHLGCSINLNGDRSGFICPCHGGKFKLLDGSLDGQPNPAPRGMDDLAWKADENKPRVLLVQYENFYQGRHEKVVKA